MKTKSYHFEIGRLIYGVKSAIFNIANYANVSVLNFSRSGILLLDYYFTIQGSNENIKIFEKTLAKAFERLNDE